MGTLSINPALGKLNAKEFEAWIKKYHPESAENWETLYAEIGGKLPDKKADKAK